MPLYSNVSKEFKHDNTDTFLEGAGVTDIDSCPGRLTAFMYSIIFHKKMHEEGVNMTLGLPNSTVVTRDMDVIFQNFNMSCNHCTF